MALALIVLNVSMPRLAGRETLRRLCQARHRMPVILPRFIETVHGVGDGCVRCVESMV
jgi:FixJ family two-component response regulator